MTQSSDRLNRIEPILAENARQLAESQSCVARSEAATNSKKPDEINFLAFALPGVDTCIMIRP